jgi:glutamine synthetase
MTTTPTATQFGEPLMGSYSASGRTENDSAAKVLQGLREAGVQYCIGSWTDTHGRAKAKFTPIEDFAKLATGTGPLYGVHALEGMGNYGPADPDQAVLADLSSVRICPWDTRFAWFAGDLVWRGGESYPLCSRNVLKRQIDRAAEMGLRALVGIEAEFYAYKRNSSGGIEPFDAVDSGPSWGYDVHTALAAMPLLTTVTDAFRELTWHPSIHVQEAGHSQFEVDFGYHDALEMGDRWVFAKELLRWCAREHDAFISYMPKPFTDAFRSGAHYNLSLVDLKTQANVMRGDAPDSLSETATHFIGGILRHASAITAVTCPTVNSYQGLVSSNAAGGIADDASWAPVAAAYGPNNRSTMIRLPNGRDCIEVRATDVASNVYLGLAMTLAAGLEGIEQRIDPGAPMTTSLYAMTPEQRQEQGIKALPANLSNAVEELDADPLTEQVFGAELKAEYIKLKRAEWDTFHGTVTDWMRETYLERF